MEWDLECLLKFKEGRELSEKLESLGFSFRKINAESDFTKKVGNDCYLIFSVVRSSLKFTIYGCSICLSPIQSRIDDQNHRLNFLSILTMNSHLFVSMINNSRYVQYLINNKKYVIDVCCCLFLSLDSKKSKNGFIVFNSSSTKEILFTENECFLYEKLSKRASILL